MATIVNNPPSSASGENGMGFFLGVIVLIIFGFLIIYYGIPILKGSAGSNAPSVNIPSNVDVNVHPSK